MDDAKREWRAYGTQIAKIDKENKKNHKDFQVVINTIKEAILKNNHQFTDEWEATQDHINQRAADHKILKDWVLELKGLSGL